jgi:hypothetical protein
MFSDYTFQRLKFLEIIVYLLLFLLNLPYAASVLQELSINPIYN